MDEEPPVEVRAAFLRESARNAEIAAKRLAAEAQGLRSSAEPAAADRLERAAGIRAQAGERDRVIADQIMQFTQLRAELEATLTKRIQAIEHAVEKRARRVEAERAEEARTLLSSTAKRVSTQAANRLAKQAEELAKDADAWRARTAAQLAEASARDIEERTGLLAEQAKRRHAETDARLDFALDSRVTALGTRLADEIEKRQTALADEIDRRHQELATGLQQQVERLIGDSQAEISERAAALERASEERAAEADAARAEAAATALAAMEKRLSEAVADQQAATERIRAQVEAQRAEHAAAFERASKERAQEVDAARAQADGAAATLAEVGTRLSKALADQRAEIERIREQAEAQIREHAAIEQARAEREALAGASRAEAAATALAAMEKRLGEALAGQQAATERLREQAEAQIAEHGAAFERTSKERAQEVDAARAQADGAATAMAAMEERLSSALADRRAETGRIQEQAEAQLAAGAEKLEQLAGELQARIADADREARKASAEGERYLRQRRAGEEQPHSEPPEGAPIDANQATVDDLRGLELSLTQATRVLHHRDALGGFSSLGQLDDVPGIAKELRANLKRRLALPAGFPEARRPSVHRGPESRGRGVDPGADARSIRLSHETPDALEPRYGTSVGLDEAPATSIWPSTRGERESSRTVLGGDTAITHRGIRHPRLSSWSPSRHEGGSRKRVAAPRVQFTRERSLVRNPAAPISGAARYCGRCRRRDEFRQEPERFWETGDKVLVFVRVTGRGGASGAELDIRLGHLWTVQEGVAVRGEGYGNRDEALKAAGLWE